MNGRNIGVYGVQIVRDDAYAADGFKRLRQAALPVECAVKAAPFNAIDGLCIADALQDCCISGVTQQAIQVVQNNRLCSRSIETRI